MTVDQESQAQTRADMPGAAELIAQCGHSFDRVAGLTKPQDSEWLSLDLGMGQLKAMMVLAKQQLTVGGLARAMNISEPSASLLVEKLVTRGLAVRETDLADRRRTMVLASEEGRLLVERLRRSRREQLTGWLELMGERDLRAFVQGLDALAEAIERGSGLL